MLSCSRTRRTCHVSRFAFTQIVWCPYLSVKLASSMGSSSKRSGRLLDLSSAGDTGSPSSLFLLNTSCLSSSWDLRGTDGEAIVLARLRVLEVDGEDGGS